MQLCIRIFVLNNRYISLIPSRAGVDHILNVNFGLSLKTILDYLDGGVLKTEAEKEPPEAEGRVAEAMEV